MPRLISSVVFCVLVLLVWEAKALFEPVLRLDWNNKCRMVAGDLANEKDSVLDKKTAKGSYNFLSSDHYELNIPGLLKKLDGTITFIEVFDKVCDKNKAGNKKFAEIKEGGVGAKSVKIKLDIFDRKPYEFQVILHGRK